MAFYFKVSIDDVSNGFVSMFAKLELKKTLVLFSFFLNVIYLTPVIEVLRRRRRGLLELYTTIITPSRMFRFHILFFTFAAKLYFTYCLNHTDNCYIKT